MLHKVEFMAFEWLFWGLECGGGKQFDKCDCCLPINLG